jgi:hypothetical protein
VNDACSGSSLGVFNGKDLGALLGTSKPRMVANPQDLDSSTLTAEEEAEQGFHDPEDDSFGLLALWRFEQQSQAIIKDTTENNLHGIIKGKHHVWEELYGGPMEPEDKWGKVARW